MVQFFLQLIRDPKLYRYIIVGGISAIVDFSLFLLLTHFYSYHYLILATFSFIIATFANFFLCNYFVFAHSQSRLPHERFMLTYLVSGVGLGIHHTCLFLAHESLAFPLVLSKLFAMGTAFGWNFLSRKHLVFKPS